MNFSLNQIIYLVITVFTKTLSSPVKHLQTSIELPWFINYLNESPNSAY